MGLLELLPLLRRLLPLLNRLAPLLETAIASRAAVRSQPEHGEILQAVESTRARSDERILSAVRAQLEGHHELLLTLQDQLSAQERHLRILEDALNTAKAEAQRNASRARTFTIVLGLLLVLVFVMTLLTYVHVHA